MSIQKRIIVIIKTNYLKLFLVICLLPIIFLNINSKHDWGDDFAQYLDQAKHIVSNEKQIEPKMLDSENYAPLERGEGFSLIISPIYYVFGNNIKAFIYFISISVFLIGIVLFSLFHKRFPNKKEALIPFLLVIPVLYNYHTLQLKMEILPIFPFMLLLYFGFWILDKNNKMISTYMLPFVIGLLISVWNMGLVFFAIVLIDLIYSLIKTFSFQKLKQFILTLTIPILSYFIIKQVVSGGFSTQNFMWYSNIFISENIFQIFQNNLIYYLNIFKQIFEQEIWGWANILIKDFAIVFFAIGIFNKLKSKIELLDVFFILYLFVLLLYPYQQAGFRFLLPIFPITLIYIVEGIFSVLIKINISKEKLVMYFLLVVIFSNAINIKNIIINHDSKIIGPNSLEAQEAFIALKQLVPENEIVCFAKPLALHFYTERKSLSTEKYDGIDKLKSRMKQFNSSFLLVCKDRNQKAIYFDKLENDATECSDFNEIWKNQNFVIYHTLINRN